jgi:geranylgeranyl pyrophosphate synthase
MKTASELPIVDAQAGADAPAKLERFFSQTRSLIDSTLDRLLPAASDEPVNVHGAIRWSVFAGGKRFRSLLLVATGESLGAPAELLLSTACALEMIHTYSLIHDDLPAMDDDNLRRGRPTCHVQFNEATAILAGDALQTLAFQTIAAEEKLSADTRVLLISELARAAGTPAGMVAGQAHDLEAESQGVTDVELDRIHQLKTAALIIASARGGAIIAAASETELRAISNYAAQLGLLFQITDDLLDVTSTVETLGKTPGKDVRSKKATYPALYGIDSARERARSVHEEACAALEQIDRPTALLHAIADFILTRDA